MQMYQHIYSAIYTLVYRANRANLGTEPPPPPQGTLLSRAVRFVRTLPPNTRKLFISQ